MSAAISSLVTPLSRARAMCVRSWSGRFSAMSAPTVTRLRSRCDSAESGQTSPYSTRFVISASFGANSFIARGVTDGRALSPTAAGRERAQQLNPDDWNYHRQDWSFGQNAGRKWLEKFQKTDKEYYPLDIKPDPKKKSG